MTLSSLKVPPSCIHNSFPLLTSNVANVTPKDGTNDVSGCFYKFFVLKFKGSRLLKIVLFESNNNSTKNIGRPSKVFDKLYFYQTFFNIKMDTGKTSIPVYLS